METRITKDIFRDRKPSLRQIRAVEVYLDGNGRKSKAEALREVGYSPSVVDHPDKVFGSRAVVALMANNELGEDDLIPVLKSKVHSEKEHIQMQALDMAFNLLGSYAPKKVEGKHDHRVGIFSMGELRRRMKERGVEVTDPL